MSGTGLNPIAILTLVQGLIQVGTEAATAWQTVSTIVAAGRDPTPDEWALAGLDAAAAHAAVQAA
jgi:hypothetical protein